MKHSLSPEDSEAAFSLAARRGIPSWVRAIVFCAAYFALGNFGCLLSSDQFPFVTFWMPSGLFVAALLLSPTRAWPLLVAAAFPANIAFDLLHGRPLLMSVLFCSGNCLEAVVGAWLVRRFVAYCPTFNTARQVMGFVVLSAVVSSTVSATVGASVVTWLSAGESFAQTWRLWWSSDALGILIAAPLILTLPARDFRLSRSRSLKSVAEAFAFALILCAVTTYVFVEAWHPYIGGTRYLVVAVVLWGAIRFGPHGTAIGNFLAAGIGAWLTAHGYAHPGAHVLSSLNVHFLQGFLVVSSMVGLVLAAVRQERKAAQTALRESESRYRSLFEDSAVPIWEEDFSRVRAFMDDLRRAGVTDLRAHFESHPEDVRTCSGLVKIVDVSAESLRFFDVAAKDEVHRHLGAYFTEESLDVFKKELIGLAEGEARFENEIPIRDLKGRRRTLIVKLSVPEGFRTSWARVMVSFIDISDRKQAQEALRKSEEKFRTLFNDAQVGMFRTRLDGSEILDMNEEFLEIFGWTREEMRGRPSTIHWADLREREEMARRLKTLGRVDDMECRMLTKRGESRDCLTSLRLYPEQGILEGSIIDVTERKQAERTLRKSEEKFSKAFRLSPDSINITRLSDGMTLDVNEGFENMMGYTRAEAIGRTSLPGDLNIWVNLEDRSKLVAALRDKGEITGLEADFRRKDGSIVHGLMSAREIEVDAQACILSITRDITELKKADQTIKASESSLASAQRLAHIGSWQWDLRDNTARWSEETFRIFELADRNLKEHHETFLDKVHPEDRKRVEQALADAVSGLKDYDLDYRIPMPDGREKFVHAQAEVLRDSDGQPTLMRGTIQDITERRQLEAQYRQAQKMEAVGRLAAGVAHDFNNQLTVIQGYSDMLLKGRPQTDPIWEALTQIRQASRRAHSTTSHLLSFSRKQVLNPECVDLNELLREMRNPVARMIGEDIRLTVVTEPEPLTTSIDKSGMQQAIMNLVVNARDAMPQGGSLVLRASTANVDKAQASEYGDAAPGRYAMVEVIDTGVGMDARTLERVFEPFFTTKEVGKGTGLGLPMVHGFINQSHGFIGFRSQPGKGTTVRILLPFSHRPSAQPPRLDDSSPAVGRQAATVLVVEDEDGVRGFMASALGKLGYHVLQASGPGEALGLASSHIGQIDLLITDVVMPEMKGDELARKLKAVRTSLKVLFVTGYSDIAPEGKVLRKPFSMSAMEADVRSLLDGRTI
jgi:two-component system, cell cycle sensor histidine kinase and response regulator CckA